MLISIFTVQIAFLQVGHGEVLCLSLFSPSRGISKTLISFISSHFWCTWTFTINNNVAGGKNLLWHKSMWFQLDPDLCYCSHIETWACRMSYSSTMQCAAHAVLSICGQDWFTRVRCFIYHVSKWFYVCVCVCPCEWVSVMRARVFKRSIREHLSVVYHTCDWWTLADHCSWNLRRPHGFHMCGSPCANTCPCIHMWIIFYSADVTGPGHTHLNKKTHRCNSKPQAWMALL